MRVAPTLLRDVMGNPFRPMTFDPCWRTQNVVGLARAIDNERAFDQMPTLANALEDSGCDNAHILDHCRAAQPHVQGCWVVDSILEGESDR